MFGNMEMCSHNIISFLVFVSSVKSKYNLNYINYYFIKDLVFSYRDFVTKSSIRLVLSYSCLKMIAASIMCVLSFL